MLALHLAPVSPIPIGHVVEDLVPEGPETIRVLVVAEDRLARAGLAALLAEQPDFTIVGQLAPDGDLGPALERLRPDAVVWDGEEAPALPEPLAAPEPPGDLGGAAPPVLLLSSSDTLPARGLAGGIRGLLPRDVDAPALAAALRALVRGLVVTDPVFTEGLASPGDQGLRPESGRPPAELLAAGLSNKDIAGQLGISEHTVKFHINAIFGKLDAHTRTEAAARAARLGLIVL
jgi:DNA-binding NarL/FixJ family response regulator